MAKDDGVRSVGDAPDRRENPTNLILEDQGVPITVGDLLQALIDLPPDTVVSLCIGPNYEDVAMTDAVHWPKHGAIFLLGDTLDDDEDDENPAIEGEWVEVPRTEETEDIDSSAAEPA